MAHQYLNTYGTSLRNTHIYMVHVVNMVHMVGRVPIYGTLVLYLQMGYISMELGWTSK
jgi:hypothetical protein